MESFLRHRAIACHNPPAFSACTGWLAYGIEPVFESGEYSRSPQDALISRASELEAHNLRLRALPKITLRRCTIRTERAGETRPSDRFSAPTPHPPYAKRPCFRVRTRFGCDGKTFIISTLQETGGRSPVVFMVNKKPRKTGRLRRKSGVFEQKSPIPASFASNPVFPLFRLPVPISACLG